jgi:hypothetical protein
VLIAEVDAAESAHPTHRSLDHIADFSQAAAMRRAAWGQQAADSTLDHLGDDPGEAVSAITHRRAGSTTSMTRSHSDRWQRIKQGDERLFIPNVGRRGAQDQRDTIRVADDVAFTAVFAAIHRAGSGVRPPFLARTLALSTTTRDRSIRPARPKQFSNSRCNCGQTPAAVHWLNRRQQVLPLGQRSLRGKCCHWQPVFSTCRMPSRQGRSGIRGAPPRGSSRCAGSKGWIWFQSSSDNNGSAMRTLPCYLLHRYKYKNPRELMDCRRQIRGSEIGS